MTFNITKVGCLRIRIKIVTHFDLRQLSVSANFYHHRLRINFLIYINFHDLLRLFSRLFDMVTNRFFQTLIKL